MKNLILLNLFCPYYQMMFGVLAKMPFLNSFSNFLLNEPERSEASR